MRSMEKRQWSCIEGKHEEIWESAEKLEKQRSKKKTNLRKRLITDLWSRRDLERRYRGVKSLVNDGEYSKAFSTVVDRAKAPLSPKVLESLKMMNPHSLNEVKWPTK